MFKVFNRLNSLRFQNQIFAVIAANLITFSHGLALGWLSPTLAILQSDNSPLESGKLSVEQESWIGSLICLGSLTGNILFGCIIDKIGRKITLILIGIPNVCFWLAVMFGNHVNHLYIGRFLAGITGGGVFVTIPLFVAEIADSCIRGGLGSMMMLFLNCGTLGGYIMGANLNYITIPFVAIWIPLLYMLMILYFPDTPQYLIKSERDMQAKNSLQFYQKYLNRSVEELNENFRNLKENLKTKISKDEKSLFSSEFCTMGAWKGLSIGIILLGINMFSGTFAITNYSSKIFNKSGSLLSPNLNTIIFGTVQIFGTILAIISVDKYGRRPLLLISSSGIAVGLILLGTYSYLRLTIDLYFLHWIPTMSISFVIFIASIGVIPLPIVVLAEVLPNKIRSIGSTICVCSLSLMGFIILKIFPILMISIELHGTMWLCGGITAIGIIYIAIFVPETKGKILDKQIFYNNSNFVETAHI